MVVRSLWRRVRNGQKLVRHSVIEVEYSNNHLDVACRCDGWIEIHSTLESS